MSYLVALGASLWSLDSIFRSKLIGSYSPLFIVLITQLLCAIITLPICWGFRARIRELERKDWLAFLFLAIASNILAMLAFTYAFSKTSNYSVPILIQKLQPFVSIFSATIFLGEKVSRKYLFYAPAALTGSFLVGFGGLNGLTIDTRDFTAIIFSLLAAFLWGIGTTIGRFLSLRHSFWLVTSLRYSLAVTFMLFLLPFFWSKEVSQHWLQLRPDIPLFLGMAFVPGLLALFVYYRGLQVTKASAACWLELSYPLTAVAINWIFLGAKLNVLQMVGAVLLVVSVSIMNYQVVQETEST